MSALAIASSAPGAVGRRHRRRIISTIRADSSPLPSDDSEPLLPTKVVLPNKKPLKWSTGTAPGDYGGPPTTTKLRKYWGGGDDDPVGNTDDFIWNKEFLGHMRRVVLKEKNDLPLPPKKEQDSGFLSINRAMSLDSVEIDLSKELQAPPKPVLQHQVEVARQGRSAAAELTNGAPYTRWRPAPTRREQAKWDRATKAATGGSDVLLRETTKERGDPKVLAAQTREQYFKMKQRMQTMTLGIGGVGVVSAYFSYSPGIAASFGVGLIGSLAYTRMLGNSVDSLADGARGLIKGAAGQPRLLVPVVLVMVYNRWNGLLVPQYGFIHLELIPMLVGFFTYKIATFIQAVQDWVYIIEKREV